MQPQYIQCVYIPKWYNAQPIYGDECVMKGIAHKFNYACVMVQQIYM